ncbi:hypothetical protein F4804DRAFT_326752 [Jackrogersella minutella]|nr:hypothetical protein F4804DRAFT_326752 [Jackrogersella minutella]
MDFSEDVSLPFSQDRKLEGLSDDDDDDDGDGSTASKNHGYISPSAELLEVDVEVEDVDVQEDQTTDSVVIHAREYQLEMFEQSLKRNIIVAMETGTGKTQVAILRIQAELERSPSDKIIWFLAPTVALCEQQTRALKSQIPGVQIKFIRGAEGIDTWSDDRTWDDYLKNVRVVVSTYQILLDASNHAFVRFERLSLIVFDEAHNCVGKHPGSKFMARYHARKAQGLPIPSILGLTASPIMKSKPDDIELIEQTLDAVCKSPSIHREELMSIMNRPSLHYVPYSDSDSTLFTYTIRNLATVYHELNIYHDPYIIRLRADGSERSQVALKKALGEKDTYVFRQMRSLCNKSLELQKQLGPWAADHYISVTVARFLKSFEDNDEWFHEWDIEEKQYLSRALEKVKISPPPSFEDDTVVMYLSNKFIALVQELSHSDDNTIGIIFAREIATVSVLAHMLSVHPLTRDRFRVGAMIGTSTYTGRKRDIGSFNKTRGYQDLEGFKNGTLNLLVATSVLEEGIDVPACNMVVCFDLPDNLKAFIQRRGRARMRESKLVMLMNKPTYQVGEWILLEEEMKRRYEDDLRQIQELAKLEESEQPEVEPLYIPETGAHIDFDQAKSHLEHFCRQLSARQYADSRPYYIFERTETSLGELPQITATVVLPMSLPPKIRRVKGKEFWSSEKNASKDAALQAYKEIYKAHLLNSHLLPLRGEFLRSCQTRPGETEVYERWSPWTRVANAYSHATEFYQRRLRLVDQDGDSMCEFDASLPVPFPKVPDFEVFWDGSKPWRVETGDMKVISALELHADHGSALMDLAYGHRNLGIEDTAQVLHFRSPIQDIPFRQLAGQKSIEEVYPDGTVLIRDSNGNPYVLKTVMPVLDTALPVMEALQGEPKDVPWLMLEKLSRKRNFLLPIKNESNSSTPSKRRQIVMPAHLCRMDGIDASNVYFGAFIPSITHMVEIHLVASELCDTLLKDVGYSDISLVTTAINAPGTGEGTNYERIEFLGDTLLKLFTATTVSAEYPHYPEGYLDAAKTNIVSNSRLCHAAVKTGLDKFILKKGFKGKKWKPLYVRDLVNIDEDAVSTRPISTKTLADVVEALIGAAYLDGGLSKALTCIRVFIPEVEWRSLNISREILFNQTSMSTELPGPLAPLEELIGYSFHNKNLLIEAATHSSFILANATGSCMERLEFLGDAILDKIVVDAIWDFERDMEPREMHLFRTAAVNADILGFVGMEWAISQEATEIAEDKAIVETQTKLPFWSFMRHSSRDMGLLQQATVERHALERLPILDAIQDSKGYPWVELAHLHIPKFFSDFFESVLGAVWVDSGSMEVCAQVVKKAGIIPYLRRMLADGVDVLDPKSRLGILAGKYLQTVEYRNEVREATKGIRELFCKIFIDGELIVDVGGGVSPEEIQAKAAQMAHKILKAREDERNRKKEVMTTLMDDSMVA